MEGGGGGGSSPSLTPRFEIKRVLGTICHIQVSYHSFVMQDIILEVTGRGMIRTVNLTGDLHHTGIRGRTSGGRTGKSNERTTIWMEVNKIYIYINSQKVLQFTMAGAAPIT